MKPIIQVEQLTRVFDTGKRPILGRKSDAAAALDSVSMQITAGECLALVGANGAGKTTLLRIIAALLTPTSGSVRVVGFDVTTDPNEVQARIGWAPNDSRSFFLPISAMQNLLFFGQLQGMRRRDAQARATMLLEKLKLDRWSDTPVADFSSGMLQRLALIRALLHEPPVLLLDEPTANLDLAGRALFISIIRDYLASGARSVVIATHDAHLVAELADQVVMLENGRVVERSRALCPVVYRVQVGGVSQNILQRFGAVSDLSPSSVALSIQDLGDGFALAAVISEVVAQGGSVLSVDLQRTFDTEVVLKRPASR